MYEMKITIDWLIDWESQTIWKSTRVVSSVFSNFDLYNQMPLILGSFHMTSTFLLKPCGIGEGLMLKYSHESIGFSAT